jgi:conjugative transposon TraK protein
MFPKTKNIETSFRAMRAVSLLATIGNLVLTGFLFLQAGRMEERAQSRVYILSAGKALEAFASDRAVNLAVEARAHIENFHELFFTLDPDEKFIADGLRKALYLADISAKRVYDNLKESGYYASVISANISQRLAVDSVVLKTDQYPFFFRLYGTEKITRVTSVVTRDLVSEGYLREVNRSDSNPHGFLVEQWAIVENRDVKVETR